MIYKDYTIVSDMDGTLLNSKGELSEENIKAIQEFISKGGKFTVATGRMLPSVERFIDKLCVNLPVILHNGTKIYNFETKEILYEEFLEEERKNIIKNIAKDNPDFGIEIYTEETVYIYQACEHTKRFLKYGYNVIYEINDELFNKKWTKVLLIGEERKLDILEENYSKIYEAGTVIRSSETYLEIVPNNVSKGSALNLLCEKLGLDKTKLITIGDNMNDLELLKTGAFGYCVENGSIRLKKEANHIAPNNDNHVMEFLIKTIRES